VDDPIMSKLARASLAAAAACVCASFALGFVQARDTGRATSLLTSASTVNAADARRARSLLGSAGTLNPDLTVNILQGVLELRTGRYAAAERTLLSITRREPMNIDAWVQLAFAAARNGDNRLTIVAAHQISTLHGKVG
jgi:predicted Zn-dependent protease